MLPAPRLDDRAFQDLVDDAKRLVMRRCPEWTDHNVSDPGVTLIETFAYLTDAMLYRLNRVPDRLYLKFLDLIGLTLFPPTAARVPVTFWLSAPPESAFVIAQGTAVATANQARRDPVVFSTLADLEIVPCALEALTTEPAAVGGEGGQGPADHSEEAQRGSPVAVFSAPPVPGDVLHVGLDRAVPSCAVRVDLVAAAEGVGVNPLRPPLVWEARCGDQWLPCDVGSDETGGLNRSGNLVLHVPSGHDVSVLGDRACGWLRARVTEPDPGQPPYSASPVLADVSVCTIGGTAVAVHGEVVDRETLAPAEGVPGQRFWVGRTPVLAGLGDPYLEIGSGLDDPPTTGPTDEPESAEPGPAQGWRRWTRVDSFADSGPDDRHFTLDQVTGEVALGPMVRLAEGGTRQYGAVPEAGAPVRIRGYAVGGGPAGNVGALTIATLRSSVPFVTEVENRYAASGGTSGETVEEARRRGPLLLRTRDRAVTAQDYELLARDAAPEVARIHCVAADGDEVPSGSVKLLVVPAAPSERGRILLEHLIPEKETLQRIAERMDQVRVAGVRVLLEPPRYRGVTVVARLVARSRVRAADVARDAEDALYALINPLPGGGPDGQGWAFGRPVQVGEVFAALRSVRGVDLVEDVRLFGADPVTGLRGGDVARLGIDKHSLVFSFEHQILVEET